MILICTVENDYNVDYKDWVHNLISSKQGKGLALDITRENLLAKLSHQYFTVAGE